MSERGWFRKVGWAIKIPGKGGGEGMEEVGEKVKGEEGRCWNYLSGQVCLEREELQS